jgi:MerR family transcriptional regulator/heat shock protein HspR
VPLQDLPAKRDTLREGEDLRKEPKEPRYMISVAARMVGIEAHTLRYYERVGLIKPHRSKGIRYYSDADIELLQHIKILTDELGISPAGIEVFMRMAQQLLEMQRRLHEMEARIRLLEETLPEAGEGD